MDKLDWLERAGIENLKLRAENADLIRKEANTLTAVALSGGGAALYFAAKESHLTLAALFVSVYLFGIALVITRKCLMLSDYPNVWNTPKNLDQKGYELNELREYELANTQAGIEKATALNTKKRIWLNRCYNAVCLTPLAAIVGLGLDSAFCQAFFYAVVRPGE